MYVIYSRPILPTQLGIFHALKTNKNKVKQKYEKHIQKLSTKHKNRNKNKRVKSQ